MPCRAVSADLDLPVISTRAPCSGGPAETRRRRGPPAARQALAPVSGLRVGPGRGRIPSGAAYGTCAPGASSWARGAARARVNAVARGPSPDLALCGRPRRLAQSVLPAAAGTSAAAATGQGPPVAWRLWAGPGKPVRPRLPLSRAARRACGGSFSSSSIFPLQPTPTNPPSPASPPRAAAFRPPPSLPPNPHQSSLACLTSLPLPAPSCPASLCSTLSPRRVKTQPASETRKLTSGNSALRMAADLPLAAVHSFGAFNCPRSLRRAQWQRAAPAAAPAKRRVPASAAGVLSSGLRADPAHSD